jgi:hypothetical protein
MADDGRLPRTEARRASLGWQPGDGFCTVDVKRMTEGRFGLAVDAEGYACFDMACLADWMGDFGRPAWSDGQCTITATYGGAGAQYVKTPISSHIVYPNGEVSAFTKIKTLRFTPATGTFEFI